MKSAENTLSITVVQSQIQRNFGCQRIAPHNHAIEGFQSIHYILCRFKGAYGIETKNEKKTIFVLFSLFDKNFFFQKKKEIKSTLFHK